MREGRIDWSSEQMMQQMSSARSHLGTEFAGKKLLGNKGTCFRCGCLDDSTRHRFKDCREVGALWSLVFRAWYRISGGERLHHTDEWITAWGARWATWGGEEEKKK